MLKSSNEWMILRQNGKQLMIRYTCTIKLFNFQFPDFLFVHWIPTDGEMTMEILASDYLHKINDNATFKVSMVAEVLETGQLVTWDDDFRLIKPNMEIEVVTNNYTNWHRFFKHSNFVKAFNFVNPVTSFVKQSLHVHVCSWRLWPDED